MTSLFEVPLDESVHVLKQVLPLMTQQNVPTIPQNYAVWYEYVKKSNLELASEIEEKINTGTEFDPSLCKTIWEKYFLNQVTAEVDGIQGAVRGALELVLAELGSLGSDIGQFSNVLEACEGSLQRDPTPEDLQKLVGELARETSRTIARSGDAAKTLNSMASEMVELRAQIHRLSRDSRTDPLTRIANRRAMDDALKTMIADAGENGTSLCFLLSDIDNFKFFNDTHGHVVGDEVLRFVAGEMEKCIKGRDMVARYGGEEFAFILPNTPLAGGKMLAESIRAIVEAQEPKDHEGQAVPKITVSLGVAMYRNDESVEELIARADQCLYLSKQNGRNRVTDESMIPDTAEVH